MFSVLSLYRYPMSVFYSFLAMSWIFAAAAVEWLQFYHMAFQIPLRCQIEIRDSTSPSSVYFSATKFNYNSMLGMLCLTPLIFLF